MHTREIHSVIGAGQIGSLLADELLSRGHEVRIARRGPAGPARPGLTWMRGDITDPAFAGEVCRGAAVVYNCTNAPYHRWEDLLRPLSRGIREAAARAGAKLVVLDNLYAVGRPPSAPFDEDTPLEPCSRKGEIRAELCRERFDAHRRGDLEVTCGRASDFVGRGATQSVIFNPRALARLARGKAVEVIGDPDMPHSYNDVADVARQLAILGTGAESWGRLWNLPAAWNRSTRELIDRFADHLGTTARLRVVPAWVLSAIGLLWRPISGMPEMIYQWQVPYVLDGSRFIDAFGDRATPIDEVIDRTLSGTPGKTAATAA